MKNLHDINVAVQLAEARRVRGPSSERTPSQLPLRPRNCHCRREIHARLVRNLAAAPFFCGSPPRVHRLEVHVLEANRIPKSHVRLLSRAPSRCEEKLPIAQSDRRHRPKFTRASENRYKPESLASVPGKGADAGTEARGSRKRRPWCPPLSVSRDGRKPSGAMLGEQDEEAALGSTRRASELTLVCSGIGRRLHGTHRPQRKRGIGIDRSWRVDHQRRGGRND